jgi:S1-C subfamily serine protease
MTRLLPHYMLLALALIGASFHSLAVAQDVSVDPEEQAVRTAVERVAPSVVRIETLGGREKVEELLVSEGPTTGLVISADGYIVSSTFNFVHEPASILVTTPTGNRAAAKIVARDKARMLLLLKIETEESLPVPEFVSRDEMRVGQYAIAVGRTFDARQPNISVGVLSALERIWGRAIQTDAKVSPANYGGPLIDIRGRVLGVLTPLMPQGEGEVSGAQWYDSGIGFAAPLADWLPRLDTLQAGRDLVAGVMGISLKPGDIYALPAEISVCQVNSPAYRAGLRAGDTLIEADGQKITRQVQLRHVLGKHYAGDKLQFVALRGDTRVEAIIELVDQLEPYDFPMLGILPMRGGAGEGIVVRYVFAESPAQISGIEAGDRITAVGETAVTSVEALQNTIAGHDRDKPLAVEYQRGEEKRTVEVKLASLSSAAPADLPSATSEMLPEEAVQPELGLRDVKLPEEKHDCYAYIPSTYHSAVPHALVVWFAPPGQFDRTEVEKQWKDIAEKYRLIVLAPRPAEAGRWHPGEIAVVRKFIDNVTGLYNIDKTRIVLHGRGVGGTMAWFTALANRNLVRGVVPVDSLLPERATLENDPVNRLFVYCITSEKGQPKEAVEAALTKLKKWKVPLVTKTIDKDRDLSGEELEALAHWIDSLDRI